MPGQAAQMRSTSAAIELLAGGVVGAAQPDQRGRGGLAHEPLAREREPVARIEREHLGAGVAAGDGVELVGRLGHERAVAAAERELRAQRQHLVAAGPDHDLVGVHAGVAGDRALEREVGGVGVVVGRDRRQARDRLGVPGGRIGRRVHVEAVDRAVGDALLPAIRARARELGADARAQVVEAHAIRCSIGRTRIEEAPAARSGPSRRTMSAASTTACTACMSPRASGSTVGRVEAGQQREHLGEALVARVEHDVALRPRREHRVDQQPQLVGQRALLRREVAARDQHGLRLEQRLELDAGRSGAACRRSRRGRRSRRRACSRGASSTEPPSVTTLASTPALASRAATVRG